MKKKLKKVVKDPLAENLSEFLSEGSWQLATFELSHKKDKVITLRLSERLLSELKKQAAALGLDTQKFIRLALESSIKKVKV